MAVWRCGGVAVSEAPTPRHATPRHTNDETGLNPPRCCRVWPRFDLVQATNCTKMEGREEHYYCANGRNHRFSALAHYEQYTCPEATLEEPGGGAEAETSTYTVHYNDLASLTHVPQEEAVKALFTRASCDPVLNSPLRPRHRR